MEKSEKRREKAKKEYGCTVLSDYTELFEKNDIDLVVNASFSQMHYPVTKDLLQHGFNVLCEKPFGRTAYEAMDLINTAKSKGVLVTSFQQSLYAPDFRKVLETVKEGKLGELFQINIRYQGFARRWDWQTLQSFCAGSAYNTGAHPIGQALMLLDFDDNASVAFSSLGCAITSGDSDDFSKIIIKAPGKPFADIEITSTDGFADSYRFKVIGTRGSLIVRGNEYELKYIDTDKIPEKPLIRRPLEDDEGVPIYCSEKLDITHEKGEFTGSSFDTAVDAFYNMLYSSIAEKKPLEVTPEMAMKVVSIIEKCHADNPLCVKFGSEVEYPD